MKNLTISLISICLISTNLLFSQLKVASNGNVGIKLGTSTPLSTLSIGGVGASTYKVSIYNNENGVNISRTGSTSLHPIYGLVTHSDLTSMNSLALRGDCSLPTLQTSGRAWGLLATAANATSGYNYGVMGVLNGYGNGAGIVGTVNQTDVCIEGMYAGYFEGDVYVTGVLTGNPVVNSDKRYKKNIMNLDTKTTLNNVLKMAPVEYNFNQMYRKSKGDSTAVDRALYDEKSQLFQKKQYGLIAQDLQKLYPDLVYEDKNGYLSVNYIGIIPLLIESIKDLSNEVAILKNNPTETSGPSKAKTNSTPSQTPSPTSSQDSDIDIKDILTYPLLEQNTPNPFNVATTIGFYLPTTIVTASIYLYDMNGTQLKSYPIVPEGKGNIVINGNEFNAGMYLYALIADGKIIDTKRMILTK